MDEPKVIEPNYQSIDIRPRLSDGEHGYVFTLDEIRKAHVELKVFNRASIQLIDNLADFITRDRTVYYCDDEIYAVVLKEENNNEQHD